MSYLRFLSNIFSGYQLPVNIVWRFVRGDKSVSSYWGDLCSPLTQIDSLSPHFPSNLYYSVLPRTKRPENPRLDRTSSIREARVLWVDIDSQKQYGEMVPYEEFIREIVRPSVVVNTGNGYHIYWLLEETLTPEVAMEYCRGIQERLGGDKAGNSFARLLRVPGSYNVKQRPFKPVEIVEASYTRYPIRDFVGLRSVRPKGRELKIGKMPGNFKLENLGELLAILDRGYSDNTDRSSLDFLVISSMVELGASLEEVMEAVLGSRLAQDTTRGPDGKVNGIIHRKSDPMRYIELTYRNALRRVAKDELV